MHSVLLENQFLRLEVRPGLGAGISDFSWRREAHEWTPLWRRAANAETSPEQLACYLMGPWTNRIPGGRFEFGGRLWSLRTSDAQGSAAHGFFRELNWSVLDRGPNSVRLGRDIAGGEAGWPWGCVATVRFELAGPELRAELEVTSSSNAPMPLGFGFCPKWLRQLGADQDQVRLRLLTTQGAELPDEPESGSAGSTWAKNLAEGLELGPAADMDDSYVSSDGAGEIRWQPSGLIATWTCSPELSHVGVQTPRLPGLPRGAWHCDYFVVAPNTMGARGFELLAQARAHGGVAVLQSGETLRGHWTVRVTQES